MLGRRILETCWVLVRRLRYVTIEERVAISHCTELSVHGALHDVRWLLFVVVLGPRVVHSVQVRVGSEAVSLGVEDVLALRAGLHISEIFHN